VGGLEKTMKLFDWKVRRWSGLWLGGGTGEDTEICVHLEEDIWYWLVLEFLAWDCCTRVCDWLSHVKLPKFIRNWERKWGDEPDDEPCKLEDWWGDDFGTFWHVWVESPFCQWARRHKNKDRAVWKMSLSEARKQFSSFPQEIAWVDKEIAERLEYDKEVAANEEAEKVTQV
jgi:hypothetical protein